MTQPLRWGILGTGGIAKKFAGQNRSAEHSHVVAVGSRRQESAEAFTKDFGGRAVAGYQQLLEDEDLEAVYVSLPNALHCEWTIRALEAGKHVLCEKPIAANRAEAEQMFDAAERTGRVLVEAFMYRCHPAVQRFLDMARGGAVGEIRIIRSNFTFNRAEDPNDVRYQPELAGGALMDVGSYPINFSRALVGSEPTAMQVLKHCAATGVENFAVGSLQFGDDGPLAAFTCGMCVTSDRTTYVGGSEGYMAIDTPWISDGTFRIVRGDDTEVITAGGPLDQYALEAKVFGEVIRGEAVPWITREDSLGNMRVLDRLRG